MAKVQIEESALETMKVMVQRLQDERDMLFASLKNVTSRWEGCPNDQTPREVKDARAAIADCTESKQVMG